MARNCSVVSSLHRAGSLASTLLGKGEGGVVCIRCLPGSCNENLLVGIIAAEYVTILAAMSKRVVDKVLPQGFQVFVTGGLVLAHCREDLVGSSASHCRVVRINGVFAFEEKAAVRDVPCFLNKLRTAQICERLLNIWYQGSISFGRRIGSQLGKESVILVAQEWFLYRSRSLRS